MKNSNSIFRGKVFHEQLSSVDDKRLQLEAVIDYCRDGDVLVCTRLDRLARSAGDLVKIEERLKAKGASISIMDPAMDTSTPNGRLIFNVIASIAQFEREIMLTRQREGIAKAKQEGKYKPAARAKSAEVGALLKEGVGAASGSVGEASTASSKQMPLPAHNAAVRAAHTF